MGWAGYRCRQESGQSLPQTDCVPNCFSHRANQSLPRPTNLHLALLFPVSSIKFRACLSKVSPPDESGAHLFRQGKSCHDMGSLVYSLHWVTCLPCTPYMYLDVEVGGANADQQSSRSMAAIRKWLLVATPLLNAPGRSIGPRPFEMQRRGWAGGEGDQLSWGEPDCQPGLPDCQSACRPAQPELANNTAQSTVELSFSVPQQTARHRPEY